MTTDHQLDNLWRRVEPSGVRLVFTIGDPIAGAIAFA
jgi:hypothetical protein